MSYKTATGKSRFDHDDSVEEALSFADGLNHHAQRLLQLLADDDEPG